MTFGPHQRLPSILLFAAVVATFYGAIGQSYEAEEQHALMLWNEKWETHVAPFIAQCEQVRHSQPQPRPQTLGVELTLYVFW